MSNLKCAVAVAAAVALILPNIAIAAPLAPGKPAGVKQAQVESVSAMVWVALGGIAAAGIAAASASGNSPSTFTTAAASTGTSS